jgi:hypothetical protein
MLRLSRVLSLMVSKAVIESANTDRVVAIELERSIYDELRELHRTRPRLVTFAPKQALRCALAGVRVRSRMRQRPGLSIATERLLLHLATER